METVPFSITKRDGQQVRFSLDKIMNAIIKAFQSVEEPVDLSTLNKIITHLDIHDGITVEDIQNQVEVALMKEGHYKVAKSFMLYRQKHTEDRETMEKLNFLVDYCKAENAATGSKYDANANVEHKNIATLIGELPKASFIRLNRRLLTDRIKKMYGKELAMQYLDLLTHHFIWGYGFHRRQLQGSDQPEELLRWLCQYGLYGLQHVERRLRHTRVPDVSELFPRAGIRPGVLERTRPGCRPLR